ncbi:hypothetical protein BDP27DRAFT_1421048 [Rhodocollybia butyracea]|uniref:Uncharacterized protein n=1 Tax=Rhodocollybia butyracea TaxID=206335 RepID=A0A9P5PP04_9AGAR|nr:hypothetical protein BDP27DRAFT_1421048 [Rhodocollybia butyracea]
MVFNEQFYTLGVDTSNLIMGFHESEMPRLQGFAAPSNQTGLLWESTPSGNSPLHEELMMIPLELATCRRRLTLGPPNMPELYQGNELSSLVMISQSREAERACGPTRLSSTSSAQKNTSGFDSWAYRAQSPPLSPLSLRSPRFNGALESSQSRRSMSPPSLPTSPRWNRQNLPADVRVA